ncbi:hypothetical protein TVAG_011050 [Trichomonas vaginalis G3]|uniref:Uncharacterized protein n=1 Tax=Trichomonas vaginalis (strain ATCC PRA-98 / G3) TaxID=412133 RepID=A2DP31_TRIV3|nr:hypothetical protein TVAGG3_0989240 [Trichomonas vaginalis G3]EAY17880.1 hypothetical protein TVAG_011050 [Trichomonas vaginalis G3]KAI5489902.1 hypothetical protein TVAGG3_0989240 [Trichomonas vaginalis G3]|eukprot:XP_001330015.1 hypothetical protein [Trichomonas vaginalis G3]
MDDNQVIIDIPGAISEAKQVQNPQHRVTKYMDVLYAINQAEKIDERSYKHILSILEDTYALCRQYRVLNSDEIKEALNYIKRIVRQMDKNEQDALPLTQTKLREYIHQTIGAMRFIIRDLKDSKENPYHFQLDISTVLLSIMMFILFIFVVIKVRSVENPRKRR